MATIIDQLVVELGLDPTKFTAAQKAAMESFKKTSEEASVRAKTIEAAGQRAGQFFTKLRNEALGFFALLIGGYGLKEFVTRITTADAATNRLGRSIGVSAVEIANWGNAATLVGGSAEAMANSFRGFSDEMQELQATGESNLIPTLYAIGRAGGKLIDVNKPLHQIFLDIAEDLESINKRDPAQAHWLGRRLGLDEGMVNLLVRGRNETRRMMDEVRNLNPQTKAQLEAAEQLATAWNKAALAAESLGRSILTSLTPSMVSFMGTVKEALLGARELVEGTKRIGLGPTWYKLFGGGAKLVTGGGAKTGAAGGGDVSLGVLALQNVLKNQIPGFRTTALNDQYHKGTGSKHEQGLALDFAFSGSKQDAAALAARLQNMLGPGATVLDEYNKPSARSTGPHMHIQFNSPEEAAKFGNVAGQTLGNNISNKNQNISKETHIGTVNINAPQAKDATDIAKGIYGALDDIAMVANTDYGTI